MDDTSSQQQGGNAGSGMNPQNPQNPQQQMGQGMPPQQAAQQQPIQQPVQPQPMQPIQPMQQPPMQQMPPQQMPAQGVPYNDPMMAGQGGGYDPMYDPAMGQQAGMGAMPMGSLPGQMPAAGGPPPPPPPPSPPANFQLGALLAPVLKVKVPAHTLQFDEQYFLHLLAGSISLTKDEKARIVESIPKLKQSQIDELVRIFEEERHKFAELGQEHVPQLEKLAQQHYQDWLDIEMHQEQSSKADEDKKKAEELRKQLGLN